MISIKTGRHLSEDGLGMQWAQIETRTMPDKQLARLIGRQVGQAGWQFRG